MSSFKLFPLKSRCVNELEILGLSERECAIWLTPFEVSPQCPRQSLHKPLDIFAIGPAKWSAPGKVSENLSLWSLNFIQIFTGILEKNQERLKKKIVCQWKWNRTRTRLGQKFSSRFEFPVKVSSLSKPCTSFPIRAHSDEAPDVICIVDKIQLSKSIKKKLDKNRSKFEHTHRNKKKPPRIRSPLSSIKLWFRSMVFSAGLLFEITDTASLCMKSDLSPRPSRWSSSSHMLRFNTWRIRSRVSFDNRVCDTFNPLKNVLYSSADTIAMRSLEGEKGQLMEVGNFSATYFGSRWSKSLKFITRLSCER